MFSFSYILICLLQNSVTEEELEKFIETGRINVLGHELSSEEVEVVFTCSNTDVKSDVSWETNSGHQTVVLLNVHQDEALINEGLSREIISRIQQMRKTTKLHHIHDATAYCTFKADGYLLPVLNAYVEQISRVTGTKIFVGEPEMGVEAKLDQTHKVQWSNKTMEEEFAVSIFEFNQFKRFCV
jgi:hypothetical protein